MLADAAVGEAFGGHLAEAGVDDFAGDVADQRFGVSDGGGGCGVDEIGIVLDETLHRGFVFDFVMDQAEAGGDVGLEAFGRNEQRAGPAWADGVDDVGRDRRRDDAELHFREGKDRALLRDGDVAGGGDATRAGHRRAVQQRNGDLWELEQPPEHFGHAECVFLVLVHGVVRGGFHPFEIGAGGEDGAVATDEDEAAFGILGQGFEGIIEFRDHLGIERVALLWAIEGQHRRALGRNVEQDVFIRHGRTPLVLM